METKQQARARLTAQFGSHFEPVYDGIVGVASPESVDELRRLILSTGELGLALVPRGAGSSALRGADAGSGVVVSFREMNGLLAVDSERQLAVVEPGITWDDLRSRLLEQQLMPRVYPSSSAFSTVGGFVAQGGFGVGSFQFGSAAESVASTTVLTETGRLIELDGDFVDLVAGAEGRTGLLSAVVLRLQPLATMRPLVAAFERLAVLEQCIQELVGLGLPLWSVSAIDRAAVDLHRCALGDPFELPGGRYALLVSFRDHDRLAIVPWLRGAILAAGGQLVQEGGDNQRWVERFMSLQALGTTPVPMQYRLPLGHVTEFVQGLPYGLRERLAFECLVAKAHPSVSVRLFFTRPQHGAENRFIADELLHHAEALGGVPYGTGLLYRQAADRVYGSNVLARMHAFQLEADPAGRLNPGKAFPD